MTAPTPQQLQRAFGLASIEDASLTPWASVHRGRTADGLDVVVKRTAGSGGRAEAMADWTRALAASGIATVTPVALDVPNPQPVSSGTDEEDEPDWWVVYPFIDGRPYAGAADLASAGDLLGRFHALDLPADLLDRLRPYAWTDQDADGVANDLATLDETLTKHGDDRAGDAVANVRALGERWWSFALPALRDADTADPLPRAGVTSDFKAANLVWTPSGEPTLVDPDNGGLEPRLFDLALALVLFHTECPTAPARPMTPDEWRTFAAAYLNHVELTERERALWPTALDHLLWEEGTWALEDADDDAWADPRQGGQLMGVALLSPADYPLPRVS